MDAITRQTVQDELLRIWHATGTTILFITHAIEETTYLLLLGGAPTGISGIYEISAPRPRQRSDVNLLGVMHKSIADLSALLQEGAGI
jgi:NitT/TauT family transport system ATP-binding protein